MMASPIVRFCQRSSASNIRSIFFPTACRGFLSQSNTKIGYISNQKRFQLNRAIQCIRTLKTSQIKWAYDERELRADYCITYDELKHGVEHDKVLVVDVRRPEEVADGRIQSKRFVNIPVQEFAEALQLSDQDFKDTYGIEKPSKDASDIVFHCKLGGRSTFALRLAQEAGYTKSKHYPGGWTEWSENNQ